MNFDPGSQIASPRFVLGLDLDGVCANFYGHMRRVAAEWKGVNLDELTEDVSYGLPEWGMVPGEYERMHRFAVTQRQLFELMDPIVGAPQSIRRLGTEGIRIRIITHRPFIRWFHEAAVAQTVRWLDNHAIPYWDLCFMRDKEAVDADLYVEDSPDNVERLCSDGRQVIVFANSINKHLNDGEGIVKRAESWSEVEDARRQVGLDAAPPALQSSSLAFSAHLQNPGSP
jgi:5'(3')-deoxyribonucleotidase